MKIYLLDRNYSMTHWWERYFKDCENIEIVCDNFNNFMNTHDVECVVSPANSYGLMDGGYDYAITEYFGQELPKKVQQYIVDNCYGEQPVGTSIIVDINEKQKLIHTPTMRVPSEIKDPLVIYNCMRTCLILAEKNGIQSIVIPGFGGACGNVEFSVIAEMMFEGYKQVLNPPKSISWEYANRWLSESEM